MKLSKPVRFAVVLSAALALAGLASCDKVQEAVEQAKTESAKLQAQVEAEAKKQFDQSTPSSTGSEAAAPQTTGAAGELAGTANSGTGVPAVAPAPAPAAKSGAVLIQEFLALQPFERKDEHLLQLANLDQADRESIERLELQGSAVTSQGLAVLPKFPRVKQLNLTQKKLTAAELAAVGQLSALEELVLDHAEVDDQELAELKPLTQLKSLSLTLTQVTDAGLPALRDLAALEKLVLAETRVTGAEIAKLDCLPGLKHLDVSNTSFSTGAELALRQMNKLQVLHASACGMNDPLVTQIKGRRALRELDLSNSPQISDRSAGQLSGCADLELLYLASTPISDVTLGAFRRMKGLKELNIMRTGCSASGVAALQKSLPELKIKYP